MFTYKFTYKWNKQEGALRESLCPQCGGNAEECPYCQGLGIVNKRTFTAQAVKSSDHAADILRLSDLSWGECVICYRQDILVEMGGARVCPDCYLRPQEVQEW